MRRILVASVILVARTAAAESACVASFEHAQELRQSGKLRDAQVELRSCAKPECPPFIQRDCTTWAAEVERDLPSLVVATHTATGDDLVTKLQIDGVDVPSTGGEVRVDPGEHDVRAEAPGYQPAVSHVVLHVGERRNLTLSLPKAGAATPDPLRPPPSTPSNGLRTGAWITGGIAVVGLATFGVLATHGFVRENDLASSCGSNCPHDSVQAIRTEYLVGDVALATGIVAAVVSTILFVVSRGHSATQVAWAFP